jgi:hypothetical protein
MSLTKVTYSMILGSPVNVLDYGAIGDGVTDDTAAIQAALNAGNFVYLPAGDYLFTTLTMPADTQLVGENVDVTFLSTVTTGNAVAIAERNTFKDLTIRQTSGTKQGKGLFGNDKYWLITECVKILDFDYGLYCSKSLYHSHKQTWFEECNYGCYYWGAAGSWNSDWFNNVITFDTCRFNKNTNVGAYIKGAEVDFINPDFSADGIGLQVLGENASNPAHGIKVITPYAELTDIVFSFSYAYAEINGGFVQGGPSAGASALTSIVDADNSKVWWTGKYRGQDYWDFGYRLTNSSSLILDDIFQGIRASDTIDATSFVSTSLTGSFTATLTGCTTSPTVTATYVMNRGQVTVSIPANSATSNTTACSITGLPASITPTKVQVSAGAVIDNAVNVVGIIQVRTNSIIDLFNGPYNTAFTNTGTKGHREISLTYQMT